MAVYREGCWLGRFIAPRYTWERLEDDGKPPFWMGPAWLDRPNRSTTYFLRPFNVVYRLGRRFFEYLYWPFYLERFYALQYNILRRCVEGRCWDPVEDEAEDRRYTMEGMKEICQEMRNCTYKGLQEVHRKWVGY